MIGLLGVTGGPASNKGMTTAMDTYFGFQNGLEYGNYPELTSGFFRFSCFVDGDGCLAFSRAESNDVIQLCRHSRLNTFSLSDSSTSIMLKAKLIVLDM